MTGVKRSVEIASDTARRPSANSPSVELTNTRAHFPSLGHPSDTGHAAPAAAGGSPIGVEYEAVPERERERPRGRTRSPVDDDRATSLRRPERSETVASPDVIGAAG